MPNPPLEMAERVARILVAGPWFGALLALFSLALLYLIVRVMRRPVASGLALALPHLAAAPLLLATGFTVIGFVRDTLWVSYHGSGAYVPAGVVVGALAMPVGVISYVVLMPLSLIARSRCVRIGTGDRSDA